MADDDSQRPYCFACGRPIHGPVNVYCCPDCGSYNVGHVPMTDQQMEEDAAARAGEVLPIGHIPLRKYLLPRPPKGVPKALWEHIRPLRFLAVLVLILLFAAAITLAASIVIETRQARRSPRVPRAGWSRAMHRCILPAMFLGNGGWILIPYLAKRRLRRFEQDIITDDLKRCLECGYPLKGLPAEHRCPECGHPYSIDVVKETWRRYFKAQQ